MKTNFVSCKIDALQHQMYSKLNRFSQSHAILGRFYALSVSIVDVGAETLRAPFTAIERVVMAAINLLGVVFSAGTSVEYTLKDVLYSAEGALANAVCTPIALAFAPVKLIFQFSAIIIDPEKVQPINYCYRAFRAF